MNKRVASLNDVVGLDFSTFVEHFLIDPQTGAPFVLTNAEREFARHAYKRTADGRFLYPEQVFSAPMKSGKTQFAAMNVLYVVRVLGGRFAEGICVANDFEQAATRVFQAIARMVEASPTLASDATVTAGKITFTSTGSTIIAITSDYASAAGANPNIVCFDELWGNTSERSHRLWDELVPPPTRKLACRLTVTYAGFEGESTLLENLYKRGKGQRKIGRDLHAGDGILMFWTHELTAPWQSAAWLEQMRATLRPTAFLRRIRNYFVTTESTFIDMAWWDKCTDENATPLVTERRLPIWCGVDASVKRDSTAIVACSWDYKAKKARMVWHKVFQPSQREPLDFEATVEATLLDLRRRFRLKEVRYDPYAMQSTAQRLLKAGVPMIEYPQSPANITEASTNLYELIKGQNLIVYPDKEFRLAVQRAVAVELPRGWKITKEKSSHKIDCVVALGMAALGAVQGGITTRLYISPEVLEMARRPPRYHRPRLGEMPFH